MPWLLDEVFDPGDMSNKVHDRIKIVDEWFSPNKKAVLRLEYGTVVDDEWVAGHQPDPDKQKTVVEIDGDRFLAFIVANEALYNQVKAAYYAELASGGDIPAGQVE
jgi:hypothetical protein